MRLGHWLRRRAENVAVALLSVMFATFIVQIFARYVLNNPVGWSEEVIITTWLWTVLWGAAFILREVRGNPVRHHLLGGIGTDTARLHGADRRRAGHALRNIAAGGL